MPNIIRTDPLERAIIRVTHCNRTYNTALPAGSNPIRLYDTSAVFALNIKKQEMKVATE